MDVWTDLDLVNLMAAILLEEKSAWLMTHWYVKTHVSWLIFPLSLQLAVKENNQKVIYGRTNVHSCSQSDGSHFTSNQRDPWLTHMSKFIFRDSYLYCDSDLHCLYIDRDSYIYSSWQIFTRVRDRYSLTHDPFIHDTTNSYSQQFESKRIVRDWYFVRDSIWPNLDDPQF